MGGGSRGSRGTSRKPARSASRNGRRGVGRDYLQGKCTRQNCKFKHPPTCRDWKKGSCGKEHCNYLHGMAKVNTSRESSAGSNGSRGRSKDKKKPKSKKSKDRSGSSSGGKPKNKNKKNKKGVLCRTLPLRIVLQSKTE